MGINWADLGLHTVPSKHVSVPGLKELPLTIECKVIYSKEQDLTVLPEAVLERFYPEVGTDGFRDFHIAFYGEILGAYLAGE